MTVRLESPPQAIIPAPPLRLLRLVICLTASPCESCDALQLPAQATTSQIATQ